jgi:hypothetical protein
MTYDLQTIARLMHDHVQNLIETKQIMRDRRQPNIAAYPFRPQDVRSVFFSHVERGEGFYFLLHDGRCFADPHTILPFDAAKLR